MVGVVLSPDGNRPFLESRIARELLTGKIPDSTQSIGYNPWASGKRPRVMLIVPSYTRIRRPLEVVLGNVERDANNTDNRTFYREIGSQLTACGIIHLEEMKRAGVPMGLLRVGTAAKKAGYDVKILDAVFEGWNQNKHYFTTSEGTEISAYGLTRGDIEDRIRNFNPHVVGVTIDYTHQWGNARELADLVKQINPNTVVVTGGTHANGLPQDVLLDSPTDYVVLRQADLNFPELLDALTGKTNTNIENVRGIAFRKNGQITATEKMPFLGKSKASTLIPDYSLVDLGLYSGPYHSAGRRVRNDGKIAYFFTSVGCNVGCEFCAIPGAQGMWNPIGEANLSVLFNQMKDLGITEALLEDDMLLQNPKWALKVFDSIKHYDIKWVEEGGLSLFTLAALLPHVTEAEVLASVAPSERYKFNHALVAKSEGITTEQIIRRMAASGCYSVYLAVESANSRSLSTSHKPTINANPRYTKEVLRYFDVNGITTTCGFMLGFVNPNGELYVESREDIMHTISYARDLVKAGATFANPFIFTPLPGAPNFPNLENRLGSHLTRNTDEGFSHEFATIDAPNKEWTRDELNLLRIYSLIQTIGVKGYKRMIETGTWPVSPKQ
jgi:anaerobic magnesium-protoporphyrin IX monomethyl ester cyclase